MGHVLIVDDDPINRRLLTVSLESDGYRTSACEDGIAALGAVAAQPPDLVLLDIEMPGLDGMAVLERIKRDPELRHTPVILLTEDNAVNQKIALRLLEEMGYRADVAGNGLEALEALARQRYDLVLMDVQMPEMDGLEATRRIVATYPPGERPWIAAMTAEAMQGDRERCLDAGMNDYLTKPIRVQELMAAIERTPARAAGQAAAGQAAGAAGEPARGAAGEAAAGQAAAELAPGAPGTPTPWPRRSSG